MLRFALGSLVFLISTIHAQTWTSLTNRPPASVGYCLLLTDGRVMCQSLAAWYKLTPDFNGSYVNGTWSPMASPPVGYIPSSFASAVLADGRVVIVGGEYNFGDFTLTNMGAVYDPTTDSWQMIAPPASIDFQCMGDIPAVVLPNGKLLVGAKLSQELAILNPATLKWTILSQVGKYDPSNSEEGWTLLSDGTIFTLDVANAPTTERLMISGNTGLWVSAASTLQDLHTPPDSKQSLFAPGCPAYYPPGEMGPAILRPDGTVFAIGANGDTGIYTPPAAGSMLPGSWAVGPAMPSGLNVQDGPAAVLPSGNVLFGASPGAASSGLQYFEFDGTNLISVPAPARAALDATSETQLLLLPTGQVLFLDGSPTIQIYTAADSASYDPAWAPAISSVPSTLENGVTYQISGTQFNGLSQGTAYGDEQQNATNYPLVSITNNASGHVFYARTHDHSTMGVATGGATVSTNFDVPVSIEAGDSMLQVIANGIPSAAVPVSVVTSNPAPLIVTTSSLPTGQLNVSYSAALFASGGSAPYTWQLLSGSLPPGLSLNSQTGQISGIPTSSGTSSLTFQVTDSSSPTPQTATVILSLTVAGGSLTITTTALPSGQVNVPYSASLSASGGLTSYKWQLLSGSLPPGLSLNSQTGQITGTPTGSGTSSLTFKVTDSSSPTPQTAAVILSLTVAAANLTITTTALPIGQINVSYSASLAASGGTTSYTWQLLSGSLPPGLSLNAQTGQITGTPTSPGPSSLTFQVTDSSSPTPQTATVTLSLTVAAANLTITTTALPSGQVNVPYSAALSASGGVTSYTWQLLKGSLPPGLSLSSQTGQITGTPTSPGTNSLTFQVTDSSSPTPQAAAVILSLTVTGGNLTVTTTALPFGQANGFYSASLLASGGMTPYTWQLLSGSLLPGLSLSSQTGQITGIPTSPGASSLTFQVTDSSSPTPQTATVILSLTVVGGNLTITSTSLPTGQVNVPYSATLTAAGGTPPYSWSTRRPFDGLILNPQTGQISGVPTAPVTNAPVTLSVTDSSAPTSQTASVTLSLTVNSVSALTVTTSSLPSGAVNVPYSATLSASGGMSPYTWQLLFASLPAGLTLNPQTGQISGTPTTSGTGTFTFAVNDSSTPTPLISTVTLSLTVISVSDLTIATISLPNGQANVPYSVTLAASGGTMPYTWSARRLPSGLVLNPQTGQISGTVTNPTNALVTLTVTDSSTPKQQTASIALTLIINLESANPAFLIR